VQVIHERQDIERGAREREEGEREIRFFWGDTDGVVHSAGVDRG
jgi:hypothetical protein